MGGVAAKFVFKSGKEKFSTKYSSLWDIGATTIDHKKIEKLEELVHGKNCVLVVNVASK